MGGGKKRKRREKGKGRIDGREEEGRKEIEKRKSGFTQHLSREAPCRVLGPSQRSKACLCPRGA